MKPAIVRYVPQKDPIVIEHNDGFVVCSTTGAHIPLVDLRYWDVELQQAFADAMVALDVYLSRNRS